MLVSTASRGVRRSSASSHSRERRNPEEPSATSRVFLGSSGVTWSRAVKKTASCPRTSSETPVTSTRWPSCLVSWTAWTSHSSSRTTTCVPGASAASTAASPTRSSIAQDVEVAERIELHALPRVAEVAFRRDQEVAPERFYHPVEPFWVERQPDRAFARARFRIEPAAHLHLHKLRGLVAAGLLDFPGDHG